VSLDIATSQQSGVGDRLVGAFGRGDGVGAIGWAAGLSLSQNRIGARALISGAHNTVIQPALDPVAGVPDRPQRAAAALEHGIEQGRRCSVARRPSRFRSCPYA
jgi:hypothetical protein